MTHTCAAVAAAQKSTGKSNKDIAAGIGSNEDRVGKIIDGTEKPTEDEFNKITRFLGMTQSVPHTGVHATV